MIPSPLREKVRMRGNLMKLLATLSGRDRGFFEVCAGQLMQKRVTR